MNEKLWNDELFMDLFPEPLSHHLANLYLWRTIIIVVDFSIVLAAALPSGVVWSSKCLWVTALLMTSFN